MTQQAVFLLSSCLEFLSQFPSMIDCGLKDKPVPSYHVTFAQSALLQQQEGN